MLLHEIFQVNHVLLLQLLDNNFQIRDLDVVFLPIPSVRGGTKIITPNT